MTALDRDSPMPLWAQLHADLSRRLATGEFAERFPTDMELVEHYAVSRQTVREAVRRLTGDGLLERTRGRGTRVRTFDHVGGTLHSFFEQIEAQGAVQRSAVLTRERTRDAAVARRLHLGADTALVHVARLRLADDEPIALDDAWLDATDGAPLLDADLTRTGIYPLLRDGGLEIDGGTERITPQIPTPAERTTLHMPRNVAAFAIERLATQSGRPVEWRRTLIRGDRYTITLDLERGRPQARGLPWATRR